MDVRVTGSLARADDRDDTSGRAGLGSHADLGDRADIGDGDAYGSRDDLGDRAEPGSRDDLGDLGGGTPASPAAGRLRLLRARLADRLPLTLRSAVVAPTASAALVLALVALGAAVLATWVAWQHRPVPVSAAPVTSSTMIAALSPGPAGDEVSAPVVGTATTGSAGRTGAPVGEVVVDVAGRVHRPGVVRLAAGSRVVDALDRAGGALPGVDTTGVALARVLVDGEQILVDGRPGPSSDAPAGSASGPAAGSGGAGAVAAGAGTTGSGSPVNLNSATAEQLDALPGVGPVLAQRIVQWRVEHGPFGSPQQLGEVTGVGDRRLADLLPLIRI